MTESKSMMLSATWIQECK